MPQYSEGVRYIKIAKKDSNEVDQTLNLQSLTEITIPFSTGNITYNILSITEKSTYFLYSVPYTPVEWADRSELYYDFTGSSNTLLTPISGSGANAKNYNDIPINSINDPLNFSHTSSIFFTFNLPVIKLLTYPQKEAILTITGSLFINNNGPGIVGYNGVYDPKIQIVKNGVDEIEELDLVNIGPGSSQTHNFVISHSISSSNAVSGDEYQLRLFTKSLLAGVSGSFQFQNTSVFLSSSAATGPKLLNIAEPYFGPQNSFQQEIDCQPLFNNANINRRHNLFMDVDYSAGITEPTNFELIVSGSALKAEVQLSNYTTRRHVIPRYEGSKSTSQKLNTFTKGDIGTYGKSPTVESLKRMVAYCDFIGGWPPERMNASSAHILYLIDENGDVKIPDTSENSLEDVQGTFQTGERVELNSKTIGSGISTPFRNIIRGGSRIEPVLYTQIGKQPGSLWTSSILLTDIEITSGSATNNYQNNGSIGQQGTPYSVDRLKLQSGLNNSNLIFNNGSAPGIPTTTFGYYKIPSGVLAENVILNFQIDNLEFGALDPAGVNGGYVKLQIGIILKKNNDTIDLHQEEIVLDFNYAEIIKVFFISPPPFTILPNSILENDELSIEYVVDVLPSSANTVNTYGLAVKGGNYSITQTPIPTLPITVGNNNIWGYLNKTTHPSIITSSFAVSESLAALYGDPNVKQIDITNSGFNTIILPWSIKTGDEFRFEGEEISTYMVKKAYGPNERGSDRVSQTGSIEVHFDKSLPISASIANFNLDHFLIRRYVDDASSILIEGFKPTGSTGPFILTPEYSVKELNKSIGKYITILTEKNLLS